MWQYFEHIEEMEWAIEVCLETEKPVAASMCIGPEGDLHGISAGECAVRMAKAGAHVGQFCANIVRNILRWQTCFFPPAKILLCCKNIWDCVRADTHCRRRCLVQWNSDSWYRLGDGIISHLPEFPILTKWPLATKKVPKKMSQLTENFLLVFTEFNCTYTHCIHVFPCLRCTVGVNCHFDPFVSLDALRKMKDSLSEAGLLERPTYLMCQPLGYHTPDAGKQVREQKIKDESG